ncbi:MAG: MFS transporter [Deltaproteobacteria bacterium]
MAGLSRARIFAALHDRDYRLFFVAFLVNQTGFWISHISLQALIADMSDGDPFMVGLLFFCLFVPAFFLAPIAGVAADRFDRRRIMITAYALIALFVGGLAVLVGSGVATPPMVLMVAVLMGICFAMGGPAAAAVAANAVDRETLPSAISLQAAANNVTRVAGPIFAAPFLATGRFEVSFAAFSVLSLAAILFLLKMRLRPYTPEVDAGGLWDRMRSGVQHARSRKPAVTALLTVAVLAGFGVSHVALLPSYALRVLGDESYYAWIIVAQGLGAFAGALASGRDPHPSVKRAGRFLVAYAISLSMLGFLPFLPVVLAAEFIAGFFYFAIMTSMQTLLQQLVDEARRGRVMSLFQMAWAGMSPFGALLLGTLGSLFGIQQAIFVASSACLGLGLVLALRR